MSVFAIFPTGVAVVFDDEEEKDEESEVDEVVSEDEEDEDQEAGMEARKGRSLRYGHAPRHWAEMTFDSSFVLHVVL